MKSAIYAGAAGAMFGITLLMLAIIWLGVAGPTDWIIGAVALDGAIALAVLTIAAEESAAAREVRA